MARKNKKAAQAQSSLLDGAEVADDLLRVNAAAPAQVLHESRSRRRRTLVWTFIIVGVCSIGSALNLAVNPPYPDLKPDVVESTEVNFSAGKSAAQTKVAEWLAQDPSPLPGGRLISWDGFTSIAAGKAKSDTDNPANAAELHRFTLATTLEDKTVYYDATVLVSVSDALGAAVATEPTLLPRVPAAAQGWSSQVWAGYENAPVPDPVTQTAGQWAKAFTESADALRLYVGDEDATHAYMPLQGARVLSAAIPTAGYIKVEGEEQAKVIIARVELTLAWSSAADAKGSKVMYDVRVEQAHTASPKIVAWGPAGTGPKLKKYGNATVGLSIDISPTDPLPTQAPTEESTSVTPDEGSADEVDGPGHGEEGL